MHLPATHKKGSYPPFMQQTSTNQRHSSQPRPLQVSRVASLHQPHPHPGFCSATTTQKQPTQNTMSAPSDDGTGGNSPNGSGSSRRPHAPLTAEQKKQNHILSGRQTPLTTPRGICLGWYSHIHTHRTKTPRQHPPVLRPPHHYRPRHRGQGPLRDDCADRDGRVHQGAAAEAQGAD